MKAEPAGEVGSAELHRHLSVKFRHNPLLRANSLFVRARSTPNHIMALGVTAICSSAMLLLLRRRHMRQTAHDAAVRQTSDVLNRALSSDNLQDRLSETSSTIVRNLLERPDAVVAVKGLVLRALATDDRVEASARHARRSAQAILLQCRAFSC